MSEEWKVGDTLVVRYLGSKERSVFITDETKAYWRLSDGSLCHKKKKMIGGERGDGFMHIYKAKKGDADE